MFLIFFVINISDLPNKRGNVGAKTFLDFFLCLSTNVQIFVARAKFSTVLSGNYIYGFNFHPEHFVFVANGTCARNEQEHLCANVSLFARALIGPYRIALGS